MNQKQFRAFMNLLMCSDPWPIPDDEQNHDHDALIAFAEQKAKQLGFADWIDAYHRFVPAPRG